MRFKARVRDAVALVAGLTFVACGARDIGDVIGGSGGAGTGGSGASGGSVTGGTSGTGGFAGFAGFGGFAGSAGFAGFAGFGGFAGSAGFAGFAGSAGFAGFAGSAGFAGFAGSAGFAGFAGSAGFAGQGGTGGGVLEACYNGVDDDGDGAIDCADSDCSGSTCAPAVPTGWFGPLALGVSPGANVPPPCSVSGFPDQVGQAVAGPSSTPAVCSGCKCSAPEGIVCPTAALRFAPDNACGSLSPPLTIPANICQAFLLSQLQARSVRWAEANPQGGACLPSPTSPPVIPPISWKENVRACRTPQEGGGCGSGSCVPRPGLPYEPGLCIARFGDFSCPVGQYTKRRVYYQGADDTRSCSACNCSSPTGATCSGSVTLGTDLTCQSQPVTVNTLGGCASLPPDSTPPAPPYQESRSVEFATAGPSGGSCGASGGVSTGTVTPTNPVTVCCQ